ncbi:thioredoxin family protein [Undibacterium arcticum]|uniref:Thioredoxin family protein n=1 Tax=Undibacterium arcticum TaxID=1762892 RepID=A0ABV7F6N2_9BURK
MPSLSLERHNYAQLSASLSDDAWIVACLCAAWCGTCNDYRATFDALAQGHPEMHFIWIDIEDQSEVVGDLDVENFPTLLIQRADTVAFFGPVLPEPRLAERLLNAQVEQSAAELATNAASNATHRSWQQDCNLRQLLRDAIAAD